MNTKQVPHFETTIDGRTYDAEIGRVESFHLGPEDHGIFTAHVAFRGGSWGQSLPAIGLDEYDETQKRRVGTAFGVEFIAEIINRIGSPETAKGCRVVVFRDEPFGQIEGFAPLDEDGGFSDPFLIDTIRARFYPPLASKESPDAR